MIFSKPKWGIEFQIKLHKNAFLLKRRKPQHWNCIYNSPPLKWPTFLKSKSGLIREVFSQEGEN